jgi:putative tryptophan/tyrosine transport system substrate-binding protein
MRRRDFIAALAALVAIPDRASARQTPKKTPRVGLLFLGSPERDLSNHGEAFRDGLRALGWIENRTVRLEPRWASGDSERLAANASELISAEVDVIAAFGTLPTRAARQATSTIPIVMTAVGDPIGAGFVASLARPGGNITGVSLMQQDLAAKQLQLLKEAVPQIRRVGILEQRDNPTHAHEAAELKQAAATLGIEVLPFVMGDTAQDLAQLFDEMLAAGADAYFVLADPLADDVRREIAELALRHRLAGAAQLRPYVEAGVLLCYGADLAALQRRAASFVDKILKGTQPTELPVEQAERFALTINLKTAKALDLAIPPSILARADEVIE